MDIKIGSFRICYRNGSIAYMPYTEFYERSTDYRQQLKAAADKKEVELFCACSSENDLPLTITQKLVIRVATNKGQANHKESCPKSEVYETWASEHKNGLMEIDEDGKLCFKITVPSGLPSKESSSSGASGEKKETSGAKQRANTVDLVTSVCAYAWQKQTYSIKKNIKTRRAEGRRPDWDYKNFDDFMRLFFGVTNDIDVYWQQSYHHLNDLCYHLDKFMAADYTQKFLIYARVEKLSEWKEDRKYQYITLQMRGPKSANKATVRILTENLVEKNYTELAEKVQDRSQKLILTGYARHDSFKDKETGQLQHWITMLNAAVIMAADNGLILSHEYEKDILDTLCQRRILFKKPLLPLDSYGGYIPTALIEQQKGKDILIDIASTNQEFTKKSVLVEDNPEFEILLYKKKTDVNRIIDDLFEIYAKRSSADSNKK